MAAALAEQGLEVPADLKPVDVWPVAEPYRAAFQVLSAARKRDQGSPLGIEYGEILKYGDANGLTGSFVETEELVQLVQAQDAEYLDQAARQIEQRTAKP